MTTMSEVGTGDLLNRYLPTVAASLCVLNIGLMTWATQSLPALQGWLILLHLGVIVLAGVVQLEATRRHPENYPRWPL